MRLTLVLQLGGVVYVLIVLIVLSLAIPLAQAANFFVGILYDAVILLMAASRSAEDETEAASGGRGGAAGAGGGGGGGASSKVQRAKEEEKKQEKEKQTKRLSSVFSRSRNRGKSGEGSSCDAGSSRDGKPDESDVRMLVEELQRQNGGGGGRGGGGGAVLSRQNRPPSTNPFNASVVQSGVFGALAERAQAWFASRRRVVYDEVSPASEDDDYNDYKVDDPTSDTAGASSTVLHHVFDVFDVEHVGGAVGHGPSPSERSAMELFGGVLPPV